MREKRIALLVFVVCEMMCGESGILVGSRSLLSVENEKIQL